MSRFLRLWIIALCAANAGFLHATEVSAHLVLPHSLEHSSAKFPPAVIWLEPLQPGLAHPVKPGSFALVQKNKMFKPHLLVVPVGSSVAFPNEDPFFHNVFSLFNGRRFDLGLYEAGSTRSVVFSREGVSYIFCNIHSEMSAVVIALATPYYAIADPHGQFRIAGVPDGEYELHVWVEGRRSEALDELTHRIHVNGPAVNLGDIRAGEPSTPGHLNKFGRQYDTGSRPIY